MSAVDLILPAAVVAVVGMMIFPLPIEVLDLLLMFNIAFALCLLISVVYLREPERFTSLPTILLLSTLFRLGLNVSTTRQLLSTADAPGVVEAFGNFVTGGNLIVGAVVFLIVTLVQFMVVAKGAERVAEVAARFTLDAMPGKQMSIDADVRAGILSVTDARQRRIELQQESRLYGALDGAMKFVKGDSIAGILITLINISAGLLVGVTQQKLGLTQALSTYTVFTIGDGLASQIPGLLVAVAAGIAVTRVHSKDGSFVGRDMFLQLSEEPQAIRTTAIVLMMLGLVPGLPMYSFFGLAAVMFFIAEKRRKECDTTETVEEVMSFQPSVSSPLECRMGVDLVETLRVEGRINQEMKILKQRIFDDFGLLLPEMLYDIDVKANSNELKVHINGQLSFQRVVQEGEGVTSRVVQVIESFIEEHLFEFMNDTQTRMLQEVYQPVAEDLWNSLIPNTMSVTELTGVLKQLITEGVSIREYPQILQAIAECKFKPTKDQYPDDAARVLGEVRLALKRTITRSLPEGLRVYGLSVPSTTCLVQSLTEDNIQLAKLVKLIRHQLEGVERPIIICIKELRGMLAELLGPQIQVVAPGEILSHRIIEQIGNVGFREEENEMVVH